jgi:DsbC/DsbD-like thiol-disulfide interchange protein
MIRPTLIGIALCVPGVLVPPLAQAQVSASLVAESASVQPGTVVTVALHLQHDPPWHTYWINPGTGYATTLVWALPPGWHAGDLRWPTPIPILTSDGKISGNGYDGDLYLPITLKVPADASEGPVTLSAAAKWLMCADLCVPGEDTLSLSLRVARDPPRVDAAVRQQTISRSVFGTARVSTSRISSAPTGPSSTTCRSGSLARASISPSSSP